MCSRPLPLPDYETLLLLHQTSRFGDVFLNTAEIIFETHIELTHPRLTNRRVAVSKRRPRRGECRPSA